MKETLFEFERWMIRNFSVIDISETEKYKLTFQQNIYGDSINHLNCRSIWIDEKGRQYRVHQLVNKL